MMAGVVDRILAGVTDDILAGVTDGILAGGAYWLLMAYWLV